MTISPRRLAGTGPLDGRGAVPAVVLDRAQQQLVGDSRAAVATADEETTHQPELRAGISIGGQKPVPIRECRQ
jgi:hypothetical protein